MKYLFAPIFFMLFSSSYSQMYLYEGNKSTPRFEIYSNRIYMYFRGKRFLNREVEDTRMYLTSKMGYDGAGNPRIVPRELVFSLSGSECYTYYREDGGKPKYNFHYEDDIYYIRKRDGTLDPFYKIIQTSESSANIVKWYPGYYNDLVARLERNGEPVSIYKAFLFHLATIKSDD